MAAHPGKSNTESILSMKSPGAVSYARFACSLLAAASLLDAAPMTAVLQEWDVPWGSSTRPRDPSVAPDGQVWFVGQQDDYAARFDTASKQFKRFDLPDGAGPHTVLVDGFGRPWYTGNADTHIGRIDPVTGAIKEFPTPGASDPHTLTFAPDGGLWFSAQNANRLGRLDTSTGAVVLLTPPTSGARPYGILTAPDGMIWCVLFGTNKLARIDPVAKTLVEIPLARTSSRPRRIGVTSDGAIWYVDFSGGYLGRYDPKTGGNRDWRCPAGASSAPYSMTVDDRDRIWVMETGPSPNRLVGFDPAAETFTAPQPLQSGGGTVRHMIFHKPTRAIWFATDAGTLGRATVTDPPTSLGGTLARNHVARAAVLRLPGMGRLGIASNWKGMADVAGRRLGGHGASENRFSASPWAATSP